MILLHHYYGVGGRELTTCEDWILTIIPFAAIGVVIFVVWIVTRDTRRNP